MIAEQETEDKDEMISSTLTQDFDREKVERKFINLTSHYQQIGESFQKLVEEVPHMRKCQLATHLTDMPILPMVKVTTEEKVSSMYRQHYEEESSKVQEEYDPQVHRESTEKKLQSIINSIGEQSTLLLMAVGDCIVNKKSQAEIARKYDIPRRGYNEPCLERKSTRKEASSINKREREKHQKKTLQEA